jgi:uncharacterized membrane protein (UPF0127 family)
VTARRWIAIALAAVAAVALTIGLVKLTSGSGGSTDASSEAVALTDLVRSAKPAVDPFAGLTQTPDLTVGGVCKHVVIADTEAERVEGLRQRSDIGSYDGMLFVFDGPTNVGFTMSTVPVVLDIGFYRDDGTLVNTLRMQPCPKAEDECPVYQATGEFSYALETLKGNLPSGAIAAGNCPS